MFESQDRSNVVRAGSYHHSERSRASESRRETDSMFPFEGVIFGGVRRETDSTFPFGEVTFGPKPTTNDRNSTTRQPIDALDERYGLESTVEAEHRFDNFDDTFIQAVINAHGPPYYCAPEVCMTIGRETRKDSSITWSIEIPYLDLPQNVLEFYLPLDQASLLDLTNDVLRVLHVHIADPDCSTLGLAYFPAADVVKSRNLVLRELERRGFNEQIPRVVRLRGLRHCQSSRNPISTSSPKLSTRPGASVKV
jgi:hypothetical protein